MGTRSDVKPGLKLSFQISKVLSKWTRILSSSFQETYGRRKDQHTLSKPKSRQKQDHLFDPFILDLDWSVSTNKSRYSSYICFRTMATVSTAHARIFLYVVSIGRSFQVHIWLTAISFGRLMCEREIWGWEFNQSCLNTSNIILTLLFFMTDHASSQSYYFSWRDWKFEFNFICFWLAEKEFLCFVAW